MRLQKLIGILDSYSILSGEVSPDIEIDGIACDSKKVEDDFIFVAIKGSSHDGHYFIDEAVKKGAKAVFIQSLSYEVAKSQERTIFIQVPDTRKALARLAAEFYGNPSRQMKVIGITGTNGKTTVSFLIEHLLKKASFNPAVIGTINYRFNNKILPSVNTTPGPLDIQEMFSEMARGRVNYAVMEVSSHSLDQDRVEGVRFSYAIFTNLTQDHLDYHITLDNYFIAKAKLFEGLSPESISVINNDSPYAARIRAMTKSKIVTYGIDAESDISALDIHYGLGGTNFIASAPTGRMEVVTNLIGKYNVYNILASIAIGIGEGLNFDLISKAMEEFELVPGRLERIDSGQDFFVFVDYAHTDDALYNVLSTLRELSQKRIIVVFGCGGDRDKAKRPKMGKVVSELADFAIVTSDNPRSEEPQDVIKDILEGMSGDNYRVIPERDKAIAEALSMARIGDIILIAGKGHETYQTIKGKNIPFDDREVVRTCLNSRN
jgi:UDP-N-acetylmuramoyl-L-alanyl-D-glutamate--2,6-diaminopimelate ligase